MVSSDGRSDFAIQSQQALSDKYGIPTFDLKGNISTVPSSGVLSGLANTVGLGGYSSQFKTNQGLIGSLQSLLNTVKNTGGTFANTVFTGPQGAPTGSTGNVNPPPSSAPAEGSQIQFNGDTIKQGFQNIMKTIGPTGLVVGIVIAGVVLFKK